MHSILIEKQLRTAEILIDPTEKGQIAYQVDQLMDDLQRLLSKSLENKEMAKAVFVDMEGVLINAYTISLINALARKWVPQSLWQRKANPYEKIYTSPPDQASEFAGIQRLCMELEVYPHTTT